LRFIAEGFEPEGGRSVLSDATAMVSPAPYLIAYKPDGDLNYIDKDIKRSVNLIAVDPKLDQVAVANLTTELIEVRYVSVLTKQDNGTLAYQSVRKEISRSKTKIAIPEAGLPVKLPTDVAGSFEFSYSQRSRRRAESRLFRNYRPRERQPQPRARSRTPHQARQAAICARRRG
jgi:alpha-2-macroglobulin